MKGKAMVPILIGMLAAVAVGVVPTAARAHCDTLDGPVV